MPKDNTGKFASGRGLGRHATAPASRRDSQCCNGGGPNVPSPRLIQSALYNVVLGHKSKAVQRGYAKKAQVTVSALEEFEKLRAAIRLPGVRDRLDITGGHP